MIRCLICRGPMRSGRILCFDCAVPDRHRVAQIRLRRMWKAWVRPWLAMRRHWQRMEEYHD